MKTQLPLDVLPEVAEFLEGSPLPGVIGGRDEMASSGETLTTRDPGSGLPLAEVPAMQAEDVDRAVKAAQKAFDTTGWPQLSPHERGALLHRLADAVEDRRAIFVQIESLDAGKIPAKAEWDVQEFIDSLRYYTEMALHARSPQPAGGRPARGLHRASSRGDRAASYSPGTSPSC